MADHSKIEWTDATWNPITGCSVVSPGCTNCYAMRLAGTRLKHHPSRAGLTRETKAGPVWIGEVRFNEQWLDQPLRWAKPRMIFVCAHGDLFAEGVPNEWIDRIFAIMAEAQQHVFQVLTKRPERMRAYLRDEAVCDRIGRIQRRDYGDNCAYTNVGCDAIWPLPNVWLGCSIEDQTRASQRRWPMLDIASEGWTTWVSYEPALGEVDWSDWKFLRWLVSGGESGPGARPSVSAWHRGARDFAATHGIAYLFKRWGDYLPAGQIDANGRLWSPRCGSRLRATKAITGRLLDGVEHNGFPKVRP